MTEIKDNLDAFILACEIWALLIAVVGGLGNLITAVAVCHEMYLNFQTKRKIRFLNNLMLSQEGRNLRQKIFDEIKDKCLIRKLSIYTINTVSLIIQEMSEREISNHIVLPLDIEIPNGIYSKRYSDPYLATTSFIQQSNGHSPNSPCLTVENFNINNDVNRTEISRISALLNHSSPKKSEYNINPVDKRAQLTKLQRLTSLDILHTNTSITTNSRQLCIKFLLIKCDRDFIIILSLCITDFLYCAISLPITIYTYTYYFSQDEPTKLFCVIVVYIRYVISYSSWMMVGFLFITRSINLKRTKQAKLLTINQTSICLAVIWIFSFLMLLPSYLQNCLAYNPKYFRCDIVCPSKKEEGSSFNKIYFYTIVTFVPCGLVLIGCISIMIQILRNRRSLIRNGMAKEIIEQRKRETFHSLAIVSGIMGLFFLYLGPMAISDAISAMKNMNNPNPDDVDLRDVKINIIAHMFYWLLYATNFLVYVVANPLYNIVYKNFFTRVKMVC